MDCVSADSLKVVGNCANQQNLSRYYHCQKISRQARNTDNILNPYCITKVSFLLIKTTIAALIYLTTVTVISVLTDESAKAVEQGTQVPKETAEVFN